MGASWSQLASLGTAGLVFAVPYTLVGGSSASCAPCDPAGLPGLDRWAVGPERAGLSGASTVLLVALAAGTLADARFGDGTEYRAAAGLEAAAWAAAATEVAKAVVRRERPVLYTDAASEAQNHRDNTRGFPSGHAAVAFALATSYALHEDHPPLARIGALVGAAGVGGLRVAARRHFPTDVLAGAGVGVIGAIAVYKIRF